MNVRIAHEQGRVPVTVFYVQGRSTWVAPHNWNRLARAEYDNGMRNLLVDLSETTSLTSAGLRTLLALYRLLDDPSSGTTASRPKSSHLKCSMFRPIYSGCFKSPALTFSSTIYDDLTKAVASFGVQTNHVSGRE